MLVPVQWSMGLFPSRSPVGVHSSASLLVCSIALDFKFIFLQIGSPYHCVVGQACAYTFPNRMLTLLYNYIISYVYEMKLKMTEFFIKDIFIIYRFCIHVWSICGYAHVHVCAWGIQEHEMPWSWAVWYGCWEPNLRSFVEAVAALPHWASSLCPQRLNLCWKMLLAINP